METNICKHFEKKENICIACGMCFEDLNYENAWAPSGDSYVSRKYMRYSITDSTKSFDSAISKILVPLGLECYKEQVRSILGSVRFKSRLKKEDKIIVTLFYILKQHSFPISLADLLKYSSLPKYKILKVHRDIFGFQPHPEQYLRGIYERTLDFLNKFHIRVPCSVGEYILFQNKFVSAEPRAFCLAFILEYTQTPQNTIQCTTEYNLEQIRNMRRKIKQSISICQK